MSHAAFWWAIDYEWRRLSWVANHGVGPQTARWFIQHTSVPS